MMDALTEKIEKFIASFIGQAQLVLVELNVRPNRGNIAIQVLVDKPQGGITLGECTTLNRLIANALEQQNFIIESYVLEVSSPGLDRPLKTTPDFLRALGREARFFLSQSIENKMEYAGLIQKVEDDVVFITTLSGAINIPILYINKAKQLIGRI